MTTNNSRCEYLLVILMLSFLHIFYFKNSTETFNVVYVKAMSPYLCQVQKLIACKMATFMVGGLNPIFRRNFYSCSKYDLSYTIGTL